MEVMQGGSEAITEEQGRLKYTRGGGLLSASRRRRDHEVKCDGSLVAEGRNPRVSGRRPSFGRVM